MNRYVDIHQRFYSGLIRISVEIRVIPLIVQLLEVLNEGKL